MSSTQPQMQSPPDPIRIAFAKKEMIKKLPENVQLHMADMLFRKYINVSRSSPKIQGINETVLMLKRGLSSRPPC